jgi:acid phosphatase
VEQPAPLPARSNGVKYVRDSEEYATLARQIYRLATEAVDRAARTMGAAPWAVVLDVDETSLDNSVYELERLAYGQPFEALSWNVWVSRRGAAAVPGAPAFVQHVRQAGGRVVYITNREAALDAATRDNMRAVALWTDADRLCAQKDSTHTKAQRRRELIAGQGDCSWAGMPMRAPVFVGDQLGDFPEASERIPDTGTDAAFGRTCFLLPNPMYGTWTTGVTRRMDLPR